MTDRVYPAAKPIQPPPAALPVAGPGVATGNGQAKTLPLYNPNRPRPVYRPEQHRRKRTCTCRKFCCLCFIYTLIVILSLILAAAIAASIFYVLYHPKHPTFAVSSLRISKFNLTESSGEFSRLSSRLDFTLTAKNPNKKKIIFLYDAISVDVASGDVDAGNSTLPGFTHLSGNTTVLRLSVSSDPTREFDSDSVKGLKSDLGKKSGFPVRVQMNTMVEVKMGKTKTKRVGIRVTCDGIRGFQPKNAKAKKPTPGIGITTKAKCKVDLRIKIWKFTF